MSSSPNEKRAGRRQRAACRDEQVRSCLLTALIKYHILSTNGGHSGGNPLSLEALLIQRHLSRQRSATKIRSDRIRMTDGRPRQIRPDEEQDFMTLRQQDGKRKKRSPLLSDHLVIEAAGQFCALVTRKVREGKSPLVFWCCRPMECLQVAPDLRLQRLWRPSGFSPAQKDKKKEKRD